MEDKKKNIIPLGVTIGGYTFGEPVIRNDITTMEGVLELVVFILNSLVGLSVLVAVAMIIYSGYTFITAAGDPDKIQKGQSSLTAAVVGVIIVFLARTVIVFLLDNILK